MVRWKGTPLKHFRIAGWPRPRPPALVWLPALLTATAVSLPLAYLFLRTLGAEREIWELLIRVRTLQVIGRTVILIIGVTGSSLLLSLPLAWLTTRTDLPFRRLWSVLAALPLVIPSYVAGLVVVAALGPKGMLQSLLEVPFGIERLPEIYGFPGAMVTILMVSYPYALLPLQAALRGLDPSLEEASRSLGYSPWQTFRQTVMPQLRPALAAGALIVSLYTLRDFGAVSLLRYETFTWTIYLQYQTSFDRSLAAALSLVLVAMALVILILEAHTRSRGRYHRSTTGATHPPLLIRLEGCRWPALVFCGSVALLTLVMPMYVLVHWLVQGLARGEPLRLVWNSAFNSLYVSGLAAAATTVAALPVAILSVRYRGWVSTVVERSTYMGFALPGIVIALALVFFGARYATPIYQTLVLLIFAYLVLFLSQAVGTNRAALLQLSPSLEEVARSLGRRPIEAFLSITLPLVRSGILAGAILVFFATMKELPATLILSPIGFKTLATAVWSATSEAFFARAAMPALLLIGVSAVPVALLTLREPKT